MGLYISGSVWLPLPLYISTTVAIFHSVGIVPAKGILLKRSVNGLRLGESNHVYASAGMLSGPGASCFSQL